MGKNRVKNALVFMNLLKKCFIYYFWLHWVFIDVHKLSLLADSRNYSSLQWAGVSLWTTGSRVQAQYLWHRGLVALGHMGSSHTRDQTHDPCTGRQTQPLNHQESPSWALFKTTLDGWNKKSYHLMWCSMYEKSTVKIIMILKIGKGKT